MRTLTTKLLRLVVFDLDHTLWPFGVDQFYFKPPYRRSGDKILDSEDKQMNHFPEVPKVLNHLHSNGYELAVASRTTYPDGANSLIELFGWDHFIKYRQIFAGSKRTHFANLKQNSGLNYNQMLFFDDEQRNITDIKPLGVTAILVDPNIGVNLELIDNCLKQFGRNNS